MRLLRPQPLLVLLCACAIGPSSFPPNTSARPGVDLPTRFEPENRRLRVPDADTLAGNGCLTPLLDPRNGTAIVLTRSGGGYGDYDVPANRYGVHEGDLLRLDCNAGTAIGIVRR